MTTYSPRQGFLEALYSQILLSCQITSTELRLLQGVDSSDSLSSEERRLVQRIFHALRRGWISEVATARPLLGVAIEADNYRQCA